MKINLDLNSVKSYELFLKIKGLPRYHFEGRTAVFDDAYAALLGLAAPRSVDIHYTPSDFLFDYQRDISSLAIRKRKYAAFVSPGWGKSLIEFEFARHAAKQIGKNRGSLVVTPLMVVDQMAEEYERFYGTKDQPLEVLNAKGLRKWLKTGSGMGLTNWEGFRDDLKPGRLGALTGDETSCMKSEYGVWGSVAINLGKGLEWKFSGTGTPAPNDRTEYANQALFLDRVPTLNSFFAKYFVNRGTTGERWELKPHALRPFYRDLADWSIFMSNPASFGWKDNTGTIPPIKTHIHNIPLTQQQRSLVVKLCGGFFAELGGIASRSKLGQLAKGYYAGQPIETFKTDYIRKLVDSWPTESTIVWCKYNREQDTIEKALSGCAGIRGTTPHEERQRIIHDFKSGKVKTLVSKSECIGFGLNLQVCTRMIFSTLEDSWESYTQSVKRANRVGSTNTLNVHLPVTELERPMVENVLRKADRIEHDEREQEAMYKELGYDFVSVA